MITPAQLTDLLIVPRFHLTLLLDGSFDRTYLESVAGVFNIGAALAFLKEDSARQKNTHRALAIILRIGETQHLEKADGAFLKLALNDLDRWFGVQPAQSLLAAVQYVEDACRSGNGADVVHLQNQAIDIGMDER